MSTLHKDLSRIVDSDRLLEGASERALHAVDESSHTPNEPEIVAYPETTEEISSLLGWAYERGVAVTAWGAGTSLEGNPIPLEGGIVLDMSRMQQIRQLWPEDLQVRVQAGRPFHELNERLARHGLFFAPDPGASATIGGMIANNAGGVHAIKYGVTRDCVRGLQVVLADGRVIETGTRARKSSSSYDLTRLFIGSEGTLGIITEATLQLSGLPPHVMAIVATFPTMQQAAQTVTELMQAGLEPAALEIMAPDVNPLVNDLKGLQLDPQPTLLMEFHGSSATGLAEEIEFVRELCDANKVAHFDSGLGRDDRDRLWAGRYAVHEAIQVEAQGRDTLIVDVAVPVSAFPAIVDTAEDELRRHELEGYAFGHAGDGNLHVEILVDGSDETAWDRASAANEAMVHQALELDGTATGEHGIGIGKQPFMPQEHGSALQVMQQIKATLDPKNILNPGKKLNRRSGTIKAH